MPLMIYLGIAFCFFTSKLLSVAKAIVAYSHRITSIALLVLSCCHVLVPFFHSRSQLINSAFSIFFTRIHFFLKVVLPKLAILSPASIVTFANHLPLALCGHRHCVEGLHD